MQKGSHSNLPPSCGWGSLCVLAVVAAFVGGGGLTGSAQERRTGPKVIVFEEVPAPHTAPLRRFGKVPQKATPRAEPALDLTPPRFGTTSLPAVASPDNNLDSGIAVTRGEPAFADGKLDVPPAETHPAKRNRLGERAAFSEPRRVSIGDDRPISGRLENSLRSHQAPEALPPAPLSESPVAGQAENPIADRSQAAHDTSEVLPVNFAASARGEPSSNQELPSTEAETTSLPPRSAAMAMAEPTPWRIAGLWAAISLSLALSLLACSLVLFTLRQQIGGRHDSILRVELAQAGGGSFVLPLAAQAPAVGGGEPRPRRRTSVADLGDAPPATTLFRPMFKKRSGNSNDSQSEQQDAILQRIFEENLALQQGE
jgi:hypothetical protein